MANPQAALDPKGLPGSSKPPPLSSSQPAVLHTPLRSVGIGFLKRKLKHATHFQLLTVLVTGCPSLRCCEKSFSKLCGFICRRCQKTRTTIPVFQMLDQDITGRQSSINAMNEKVKTFIETTDPSTASSLQAKMKDLSARFSEASQKHKEKLAKMVELKSKVEEFEKLSDKLQTFLETQSQALTEVDMPGKDVPELSQHMQVRIPQE